MASAGDDAVGGAEAGNSAKKNRRRISDYLALGDSDGGEASPPSPPETPPQLRVPRFTCARFRFVSLGRKRDGRKEVGAKKKAEDASLDSSAGSKPAETSPSGSAAAETGGMGLSMLLLLLARTCVELNRMAEVRAQMETLLKEIRDEASRMKASARHHVAVKPTRSFSLQLSSSSSSSSCTSDTDTNHHRATTSSSAEETVPPQGRESKPADDGERTGVVELEAAGEFEAEPAEHRPTIECNAEQEDSESSDDEFIELDGGRLGGDRKWDAAGDEESEEDSTTASGGQDGGAVSAVELERRLHELLHRRNRERIEELESALRRAELKVREKEMEARLWQDTATLALQPPTPTRGGQ